MNPKQLKLRFPYMFAGENIGFSFYRGWFPLFAKLCEDIDALLGEDKRGFHWAQLKEKFGSASFYWEMTGYAQQLHVSLISDNQVDEFSTRYRKDSLPSQIDTLVREATMATRSRCIVCGEAATLDRSESYVLVLCEHHATRRRQDQKLDPPWFSDEELQ
jgi:hypothetical protein